MLLAVIVYVVVGEFTVGVPDIVPVISSKTRPVGRVGVIDQFSTEPPKLVGVSAVIWIPLVSVYGLLEYTIENGATSLT